MNSYQLLKKVNYETDNILPVSLLDYYLYKDGSDRFLVLKFANNEKDILESFKFELTFYDKQSNIISKELYHINELEINNLKDFIYEAKIKVSNNFDDLGFDLSEASYSKNTWIEGFWLKEISKEQQEELISREEELTPKSRLKHFRIKTKTMPFIIPLLLSLLVVGLFLINANKITKDKITDEGLFSYNITRNNEILITDYHGTSLDLFIPRVYDNYIVKGVAENSFRDNYFRSVTFEGRNIDIGINAFYNSFLLTKVSAASFGKINNFAFAHSNMLKTVIAANVDDISIYALYKTKRLKPLAMRYYGEFDYDLRMLTPAERAELPFK